MEMTQENLKAKNILLIMFGIWILIDTSTTFSSSQYVSGAIRLALTVILMWFVIQGHKWAKWLLLTLIFITIILSATASWFFLGSNSLLFGWLYLIGIVVLAAQAYYLLLNNELNNYFKALRS